MNKRGSTMKRENIQFVLSKYAGDHINKINPRSFNRFLNKTTRCIERTNIDKRIDIVLPGFPYKSANKKKKTMGYLPDLGEKCALKKLRVFAEDMSCVLDRDCHITICSDGFVFNDLKHIANEDVVAYHSVLKKMTREESNISVMNLSGFFPGKNLEERKALIREKVLRAKDMQALYQEEKTLRDLYYNLFVFAQHDLVKSTKESKKAFKKRCKDVAFEVMCRSWVWADLVAHHYPDAIRLTIHPYTDVSQKFPICLVPALDGKWRTPWHNVPVCDFDDGEVYLAPRKIAEEKGYTIQYKQNRPWVYVKEG